MCLMKNPYNKTQKIEGTSASTTREIHDSFQCKYDKYENNIKLQMENAFIYVSYEITRERIMLSGINWSREIREKMYALYFKSET